MKFELTNTKPNLENEKPVEWVKWYGEESFQITTDRISFKDNDQPVFFLIDETENIGTSVFAAHHPNAKFTDSTPHGVRLARAIGRAFDLGEVETTAQDLCDLMNDEESSPVVKVEKTEKGILWTVIRS